MNWASVWLVLAAAVLSCFFAAVNHALHDFSTLRLGEHLKRRRHLDRLDLLLARRDGLLLITALLRTIFNLIILVAVIAILAPPWEVRGWVDLFLALVAAGLLIAIFGVAIPVFWSRYAAEALIAHALPLLSALSVAGRPVLTVLHWFDPVVRRLLAVPESERGGREPVEQEILDAVSEGERSGQVDEDQADMIEAVVEFPTLTVDQIMTPRTDVEGISVEASLEDVKRFVADAGHSRVPVYEGDLDHITGVLYVKDLIPLLGTNGGPPFDLRQIVREAMFVPESMPLRDLLGRFKASKVHLALILDEYGGTAGLVTIEDIVEEIVGEIHDEYEPMEPEPSIHAVDETTYEVDGRVYIDDVNDRLHVRLPEDEDYDTIGGFVFATLGRIPEAGDSFHYQSLQFTIIDAEKTRVNRVRVEVGRPSEVESADTPH